MSEEESLTTHAKLPIWGTLIAAVDMVKERWWPLLRALLIPASLIALLLPLLGAIFGLLQALVPSLIALLPLLGAIFGLLQALVATVFAVSVHRIVLLGADELPNRWGVYWTRRELRFFGWLFLIGGISYLPSVSSMAGYNISQFPQESWPPLSTVYIILGALVTARIGLVLPATAIGNRPSLEEGWQLAIENFWRLFAVLIIPAIIIWLIQRATTGVLGLFDVRIFPSPFTAVRTPWAVLWALLGVFEIVVLSVSYRTLTGFKVPPPQRSNYFVRLWRGDVRLADTFWLWGFLGFLLIRVIDLLISLDPATFNKHLSYYFLFTFIAVAYSVLVWVALWRSANKSSLKIEPGLPKLWVVLGILLSVFMYSDVNRMTQYAYSERDIQQMSYDANQTLPSQIDSTGLQPTHTLKRVEAHKRSLVYFYGRIPSDAKPDDLYISLSNTYAFMCKNTKEELLADGIAFSYQLTDIDGNAFGEKTTIRGPRVLQTLCRYDEYFQKSGL